MKVIPMSIEPMGVVVHEKDLLELIGRIAGECYNSSKDSEACMKRALNCIRRGHHSPWEHVSITLKCTVDRGTSHALVRHRHCAFQQSSTIYQKFDEIAVIGNEDDMLYDTLELYRAMEEEYRDLITSGQAPSEARDVLPTNLATNLIITTNLRQWMYMIQRRCGPGDSNKMHEWCSLVREWFQKHYPQVTLTYDDWYTKHPL